MYLVVVGVNHRTAPVDVREKLSFSEHRLGEAFAKLKSYPTIDGVVILSTCNRTEVYVAALEIDNGLKAVREFLANWAGLSLSEIKNYTYNYTLYDAVHHLFRVASGLDSMILGETQILGQVRDAYIKASSFKASNKILNTLFQHAITVGKKVRTETGIDKNPVSVSYAAVQLACSFFGSLRDKKALLIGAGKMSNLTAKHLSYYGIEEIIVTNRSFDKAETFARQFNGTAIPFEKIYDILLEVDVVISCTGAPHLIIHKDRLEPIVKKRVKPLYLIDIAVPRDIDPEITNLPNVLLHDIDKLQNVVTKNLEERKRLAEMAENIIEKELKAFIEWHSSQFVIPTIVALKKKAEEIKNKELTKALNKLGNVSEREKNIVCALAHGIINQMLHTPIVQLKQYALTPQGHLYTEIFQNIFNLQVEGERPKASLPHLEEMEDDNDERSYCGESR
ncbi:glutamyl-tRNA reductase [Carboxydothermus pertinax]|uniref:Glutamyl-tRNA reductase n=1 Tax=Carboxydothermus pertinax TaxID=870242 RepID=A0A1L8CU93_9THEO|nr:glutamyl-tRNA reductase [Carboxydothermus pertinax]GAV22472.1 glutamyl-tRNA reductase [Carboxydothermus pertinax]